jgi:alpha-tubulin suppressor-like RCC1 family protein
MKLKVFNSTFFQLTGVFLGSFALIVVTLAWLGMACEGDSGTGCSNTPVVAINPDFTSVPLSTLYHNTFAIKSDGTLWGWGSNDVGQIVTGTGRNNINVPTQIGSDGDWATVSTGWYHVMAIKTNGTLWSWGSNDYGQLGNGTSGYQSGNKSIPKQVGTDRDWIAVAAGDQHTAALKRDHSLWTWGWNKAGQLGNGNLNDITKPTRVGADNDWVKVAAGQSYTIALKQDGTIWSWGNNNKGELGYRTDTAFPNPVPRKIGTDTDWKDVFTGGFNAGLKQNGTLWVWGEDVYGITGDKAKMIQIPGSGWQTVSVGNNQGFALKSGGGWYGWGMDVLFDLEIAGKNYLPPTQPTQITGNDLTTAIWKNYVQPTQPIQLTGGAWNVLIAGYDYSYGVKGDGSLWAWGKNSLGELASGNFTDIKVPANVWKIK